MYRFINEFTVQIIQMWEFNESSNPRVAGTWELRSCRIVCDIQNMKKLLQLSKKWFQTIKKNFTSFSYVEIPLPFTPLKFND